jgi:hypothetical protein
MTFNFVEEMETGVLKQTIAEITGPGFCTIVYVAVNLKMKSGGKDEQARIAYTSSNDDDDHFSLA